MWNAMFDTDRTKENQGKFGCLSSDVRTYYDKNEVLLAVHNYIYDLPT